MWLKGTWEYVDGIQGREGSHCGILKAAGSKKYVVVYRKKLHGTT